MTPPRRSILITGASSGIGRALACIYAEPGVHLALAGRNQQRLSETAAQCQARGASVATAVIDVCARDEMSAWVRASDDVHPIDLAIACAGVSSGTGMGRPREHADAARVVIETNLVGALNTTDAVVERMCARGRGQIAFLGSIAGLRGLPSAPSYCASKAAVHAYAEALRANLAGHGVRVSLVIAGFVDTPMSRALVAPQPLKVSDRRAAQIIRRGLDRKAAVIAFPRILYYATWLSLLLPRRLTDAVLAAIHVDSPETGDGATE